MDSYKVYAFKDSGKYHCETVLNISESNKYTDIHDILDPKSGSYQDVGYKDLTRVFIPDDNNSQIHSVPILVKPLY